MKPTLTALLMLIGTMAMGQKKALTWTHIDSVSYGTMYMAKPVKWFSYVDSEQKKYHGPDTLIMKFRSVTRWHWNQKTRCYLTNLMDANVIDWSNPLAYYIGKRQYYVVEIGDYVNSISGVVGSDQCKYRALYDK